MFTDILPEILAYITFPLANKTQSLVEVVEALRNTWKQRQNNIYETLDYNENIFLSQISLRGLFFCIMVRPNGDTSVRPTNITHSVAHRGGGAPRVALTKDDG